MKVCTIDGCQKPSKARGWCLPHYKRWWRRHGLRAGTPGRPGPTAGELARHRGGAATYNAVHLRLGASRGSAAAHECACGSRARHWAYDHADPNEKTEIRSDGHAVTYSTDLDHYVPMCIPCHNRFDHPTTKEKIA